MFYWSVDENWLPDDWGRTSVKWRTNRKTKPLLFGPKSREIRGVVRDLRFFGIFWDFFSLGYMRLLGIITRFFWDFLGFMNFFRRSVGDFSKFVKLHNKIQLTCSVRMHKRTKCYYTSEQIRLEYLFLLLTSCSEGSTLSISLSLKYT